MELIRTYVEYHKVKASEVFYIQWYMDKWEKYDDALSFRITMENCKMNNHVNIYVELIRKNKKYLRVCSIRELNTNRLLKKKKTYVQLFNNTNGRYKNIEKIVDKLLDSYLKTGKKIGRVKNN